MPTPSKSLDDMPLAAYGGTGMQEERATDPGTSAAETTSASAVTAASAAATADAGPVASPIDSLPVPEDELSHAASPLSRLPLSRLPLSRLSASRISPTRIIETFRTSRVAAAAGFAAVIVVGLILLSGGAASPAATAATPSKGPAAAPTILPPSGDVSMTLTGAATGSFTLSGMAGGQQVGGGAVTLAWGDAQQTTVTIAGPIDRGTRATDETLVLTLGVVVNGTPMTFTSRAGECTIGMAEVGAKVQGSFTCHKLRGANPKLTVEVSGTYHS